MELNIFVFFSMISKTLPLRYSRTLNPYLADCTGRKQVFTLQSFIHRTIVLPSNHSFFSFHIACYDQTELMTLLISS